MEAHKQRTGGEILSKKETRTAESQLEKFREEWAKDPAALMWNELMALHARVGNIEALVHSCPHVLQHLRISALESVVSSLAEKQLKKGEG